MSTRNIQETGQSRAQLEQRNRELQSIQVELTAVNNQLRRELAEHQNTEKALERSEKQYRHLVELLPEGIWVVNARAFTTFVNPYMAEILDYTVEEMLGKPLLDFMDERGVRMFQQGTEALHDLELLRKDGTRIYTLMSTSPQLDEHGAYTGAIAAVQDITERRRTQEAMHRSELRLRSLLESLPAAILETDLDGCIIECNQKTAHVCGAASKDALLGRNMLNFILQEEQPQFQKHLRHILQHGLVKDIEHTLLRSTGQFFPAELSAGLVTDPVGTPVGYVAIICDASMRKLAEDALRKLSSAVEQSPSIVMITDLRGVIEYVNPRFYLITGYRPEEILGQHVRMLKSGKHSPELYQQLWQTIQAGQEWRGELLNVCKSGDLYWKSASITSIKNAAGQPTHYLKVRI